MSRFFKMTVNKMISGSYDLPLVALSYAIAVAASFAALELSAHVSKHTGKSAKLWLVAGSLAMGFGIWTMHFVGMIALKMRMPFTYEFSTTVWSLVFAIIASMFALWVASRKSTTILKVAISGLLLGAGIVGMHYTGMAAMRMQADVIYDTAIVAASIIIAIVGATAAIWTIFALGHCKTNKRKLALLKITAASIMGGAICGMHYTGMAAATYEPFPNAHMLNAPESNYSLAIVLTFAALIVLALAYLTTRFDDLISAEHQRGQAALMQAHQLSELLDESLNEIYVIDIPTFKIISVNKGACQHLGYERDQLLSMTPMDITPDLTEDRFCERLEQLAECRVGVSVYESENVRADGTAYPVEVNLQISNALKRPVAVAIVSDISKRKALESQLMQAQKLESIGQLAAGIAHEINTPAQYVGDNTRFIKDSMDDIMRLIKGLQRLHTAIVEDVVTPDLIQESGDLIQAVDPEYLVEEVPAAIEQTLDGITHIANIVRAMKGFSHPGGQNQEFVDLNEIIQNTITVASNEWKYVASVETNFDESLPAVSCMPQEISQVVLNLIINAAHAIGDSLAEGSSEKGTISVTTVCNDELAEIRVADTGGGIPDEIKERVFDPFFTTKEVGKGTGQGLTMAYKTIVEGHKGTLHFESSAGEGTTFVISLPIYPIVDDELEDVA